MTKKKLFSRVLAVALAVMLMMALAVPSFAERKYFYDATAGNQYYNHLNIYGALGSGIKGRVMTLYYQMPTSIDQEFYQRLATCNGVAGFYLATPQNPAFAVNRRTSDGRAFMWTVSDGLTDSLLISSYPRLYLATGSYRNQNLTYTSNYSGNSVYFSSTINNGWVGCEVA